MSTEESALEKQIRAAYPAGAVGYRLVGTSAGVGRYPRVAEHGRDYFISTPELVEFPLAAPKGSYQLQFIDNTGITIPLRRQILVSVADTEQDSASDDEGRDAAAAAAEQGDAASSAHYQAKAQEIELRRRNLGLARVARKTSEISEYHAHWSSMFDDTISRFQKLDEYSVKYHEVQLKMTTRLHDELAKVPPPPPPPQDWAGLLKAGIEGIKDIATTALTASQRARPLESSAMVDDFIGKLISRFTGTALVPVPGPATAPAPVPAATPSAKAEELAKRAENELRSGKLDEAEASIAALHEEIPDSFRYRAGLLDLELLIARKQTDDALQLSKLLCEDYAKDSAVLVSVARCLASTPDASANLLDAAEKIAKPISLASGSSKNSAAAVLASIATRRAGEKLP